MSARYAASARISDTSRNCPAILLGALPIDRQQIALRAQPWHELARSRAHHDVGQELAYRADRLPRRVCRVLVYSDAVGICGLEHQIHALAVPAGTTDLAPDITHRHDSPADVSALLARRFSSHCPTPARRRLPRARRPWWIRSPFPGP